MLKYKENVNQLLSLGKDVSMLLATHGEGLTLIETWFFFIFTFFSSDEPISSIPVWWLPSSLLF